MARKQSSPNVGTLIALVVALGAGPSAAQNWGDDPEPYSNPRTETQQRTQTQPRSTSGVFENVRGYQQYTGPYVHFGGSVGGIDLDDVQVAGRNRHVETDASGGFTMAGGYRFFPWLAGEFDLTFLGGGDVEIFDRDMGDAVSFSFTVGPKLYPMGLLDRQPIPEFFQPYLLIGIGGGETELDVKGNGRDIERSSFTARFLTGFDFWFTDHIGAFMEGGYHVWDDESVDGFGVFSLGAQYRF